jgi:hypothetical protein
MDKVREFYEASVKTWSAGERLQLARLLLDDLASSPIIWLEPQRQQMDVAEANAWLRRTHTLREKISAYRVSQGMSPEISADEADQIFDAAEPDADESLPGRARSDC